MGINIRYTGNRWKRFVQDRRPRPGYPRKTVSKQVRRRVWAKPEEGPTVLEPTKDTSEALECPELGRRPTDISDMRELGYLSVKTNFRTFGAK